MISGSARTSLAAIVAVALLATAGAETVEQHKKRQEERIEKDVDSGKLSPEEAQRLEKRENTINQEEQDMRDLNGSKLTARDKRVLRNQQRKTSREIHHEKHDHAAE